MAEKSGLKGRLAGEPRLSADYSVWWTIMAIIRIIIACTQSANTKHILQNGLYP